MHAFTLGLLALTCAYARGTQPVPLDAVATVLSAFRSHPIVALDDVHAAEASHAFRMSLIRDPRFPSVANDIVVEFGNSRYQETADRFVNGASVDEQALKRIWQNTTLPTPIWDRPIYEDVFRAVRSMNARLPRVRRVRILLGDPPIDWSTVRTADDRRKWLEMGHSSYPAEVIQREVLAKGHRALVIYGGVHLMRQSAQGANLIARLERQGRSTAFVVLTHPFADVAALGVTPGSLPVPSVLLTRGTSLENQADAVLYLGPRSAGGQSLLPPALCGDTGYRRMRLERMTIAGIRDAAAQLDAECSLSFGHRSKNNPDFSGVWKPVNGPAPPAPAPVTPGAPPPPRTLSLTIHQSATELKIERRVAAPDAEALYAFIYKLDGTESVNQMSALVFRTKAAWDGDTLILSSTISFEGKPFGESRDAYRLEAGSLVVDSTRKVPAGVFSERTTYTKQ